VNAATIDSAILLTHVHFFQVTVSATHDVNIPGLVTAMQQLNVPATDFALFYFVVPPDVFPTFANPTWTPVGAVVPSNVHYLVMEMAVTESTGLKRKVRAADLVHALNHGCVRALQSACSALILPSYFSVSCAMCRLPCHQMLSSRTLTLFNRLLHLLPHAIAIRNTKVAQLLRRAMSPVIAFASKKQGSAAPTVINNSIRRQLCAVMCEVR
jgi:hypothetical protein